MNDTLAHIWDALFPATCAVCHRTLVRGEGQLCLHCLASLDATAYTAMPDNPTERQLLGRIPLAAATSIYHFRRESAVRQLVHAMKFADRPALCRQMGRLMGLELLASGRFDGVDALVPVPLHWLRRLGRGYNQSELLCRGIADVMPRPVVTDAVVRHRYTRQQSLLPADQRARNTDGAFRLGRADRVEGRHLLLVDDVMTTGATLVAAASPLLQAENVTLSVATLSIAG